jgi:hypothetical protein
VVTPAAEGGDGAVAELDDDEGAGEAGVGDAEADNEGASDDGAGDAEAGDDGSDLYIEGPGMTGAAGAAAAGAGGAGASRAAAACRRAGAPVGGSTGAAGVSKMPYLNRNNSSSK